MYDCFLEYQSVKDNLIKILMKILMKIDGNHSNKIDEELKKRLKNMLKFSNKDTNKFNLVVKKRYLSLWENEWLGKI